MVESTPDARWWATPRRLIRRLLSLDDTPHAIALGTAIGMFIGLTPTVGIQMIIVLLFAVATRRLFHFNRAAGLITVYVSNPITMLPMYAGFYITGRLFVAAPLTSIDFQQRFEATLEGDWTEPLRFLFTEVGWPMLLGSLLIASVGSAITYPVVHYLLKRRSSPHLTSGTTPPPVA